VKAPADFRLVARSGKRKIGLRGRLRAKLQVGRKSATNLLLLLQAGKKIGYNFSFTFIIFWGPFIITVARSTIYVFPVKTFLITFFNLTNTKNMNNKTVLLIELYDAPSATYKHVNRVTRLGEFSFFNWLFTLVNVY
jgi:hypothetical protein